MNSFDYPHGQTFTRAQTPVYYPVKDPRPTMWDYDQYPSDRIHSNATDIAQTPISSPINPPKQLPVISLPTVTSSPSDIMTSDAAVAATHKARHTSKHCKLPFRLPGVNNWLAISSYRPENQAEAFEVKVQGP